MKASPRNSSTKASRIRTSLRTLAILIATTFGIIAAAPALSQPAVFTLQDQTNLVSGTYQIYVTGASTTGGAPGGAGPLVLYAGPNKQGFWAAPATPNPAPALTTLPCYKFPQEIGTVPIDPLTAKISARVYYFVVTDLARFPSCNPTGAGTGLFNQGTAFTYTLSTLNLTNPTVPMVTANQFPAWVFSEIGASSTAGTIDLSQVDFLAFPMNVVATVTPAAVNAPPNPPVIGNPVTAASNPSDAVNYASMVNSYRAFINGLAQSTNGNKNCVADPTPVACAYLDLVLNIGTGSIPQSIILNPGGLWAVNPATTSRLNTVFDTLIGKLWTTTNPPALAIDSGGALGGSGPPTNYPTVTQDVFTSSIVPMNYPGSTYPVNAMKFVGIATGYIAFVFSPKDYQAGCTALVNPIPPSLCPAPTSSGYQVFAAAGMLGPPVAGTYDTLRLAGLLSSNAAIFGNVGYDAVVARLGLLISGAMNRGVALVPCTGLVTWQCWQNGNYWYPTATSTTFPDITQNLYSRWIHTATINGTPMFLRPPGALNSASSVAGGGPLMGMAYGFAADENSTPAANPPQPTVPSKMDQNVAFNVSTNTITFGPWQSPSTTPTLTVTTQGAGTVTSSPAGINCGAACSQAYPLGTTVVLTASPSAGWIFAGWSGACAGGSTTCSVTLNAAATANAQFTAIAPATFGLSVAVNGSGSVTSAPPGISCGATCSAAFTANTMVTLTANAAAGWAFAGWSGACSGSVATCSVTMSQAQTVGAAFVIFTQYTLTVTGGSNGIVTSLPGAINCGTTCIAGFGVGTAVNLIARPNPGYQFAGWSGACGGTNTCDLIMNANQAVQASFIAVPPGQYALTVHDFGNGTITSIPAGISCGVACSAAYPAGTTVTLLAVPGPSDRFAGWTGACSGVGTCVVLMNNVEFVNATFVSNAVPVASSIPTLSEWGLLLMVMLILLGACLQSKSGGLRLRR